MWIFFFFNKLNEERSVCDPRKALGQGCFKEGAGYRVFLKGYE